MTWYGRCDILMGCNDNVAGFVTALHPLGSSKDADLHIFTKEVKGNVLCFTPLRLFSCLTCCR